MRNHTGKLLVVLSVPLTNSIRWLSNVVAADKSLTQLCSEYNIFDGVDWQGWSVTECHGNTDDSIASLNIKVRPCV